MFEIILWELDLAIHVDLLRVLLMRCEHRCTAAVSNHEVSVTVVDPDNIYWCKCAISCPDDEFVQVVSLSKSLKNRQLASQIQCVSPRYPSCIMGPSSWSSGINMYLR